MRIFFDTNVLVSAFTARGLCADLLRKSVVLGKLVVSDPLLEELRRILANKFATSTTDIEIVLNFLQRSSIKVTTGKPIRIDIKDRDDAVILSSAIHGETNFFITGDKEVLALKEIDGMRIRSPREFWLILRTR